ncbi:Obscurin-like protein 1 [Larimichthys crocea]|uniref:Obscurin-like protein 1 n=1 Tax=Larimichthys crocea TaxID=215358 RepID=A0A6G0J772_LARCR|nr:Obscurin-like protein 1 [Larimichthys crocea]
MDVFGGAPRFLAYPRPVVVQSGTDAVLKCQIGGDPRPAVIWERNNEKIDPQGRYRVFEDGNVYNLIISAVTTEDSGQYICKAKNSIGETYAAATLKVEGEAQEMELREENKPRFLIKPLSTRVGRGEDAVFSCKLWGNPRPEVVWEKDGRKLNEIFESTHFSVGYQDGGWFQLKIFKTRAPDGGVYTCKARNEFGEALAGAVLLVDAGPGHEEEGNRNGYTNGHWKAHPGKQRSGRQVPNRLKDDTMTKSTKVKMFAVTEEPPVRFKQPLIDLEVWEQDLAVLECEVPEDSVPITWYLEDRRLQPGAKYGMEEWGTKRRLTIRDIGVDDDGIYLCEMPDGGRSIAEVAVKGTILRKLPRKVDVLEGENAAFCVEVEKEEMDIHWYKDGVELRETHQTILKSFGRTHILVFVNTMPQDSGLVTFLVGRSKTSSQLRVKAARHCPPSCPVGVQINTERANAALLSWVPAQDTRKNPPSGYVLERQEVGTGSQEWLQCLTTDSATSVEILGDSVPCEADYRFRICSVNKYGKSNNVEFPRAVHLVPVARIQAPLQDALVPEGQDGLFSIELSASVIGTWFLNGTQLQEDERYSMRRSRTHQSLRIRGVRDTDNGAEITFIAYGIRDSAALYIQVPPVTFADIPEEDLFKSVVEQEELVLSCEVSRADGVVQWYKDGTEMQPSNSITMQAEDTKRNLTIHSTQLSDTGTYTCRTGDNILLFKVNIREPPVMIIYPKEDVHLERHVPEEIILSCELSRPNGIVSWYKDGQKLQESENIKLKIEGPYRRLKILSSGVEDSGEYVCDTADDSIFFHLSITEPPVRIVSPSQSQMELCQQTSERMVLSCEISRPNAVVRWYRDGLEVEENDNLILEVDGVYRRLIIPETTVKDSAEYVCDTADDSMTFFVNIAEPPVRFVRPRKMASRVEKVAGQTLILDCEVSRSNAEVTWKKNGEEVEDSRNITILEDGVMRQLTVHSLTLEDAGQYVCDAKDDVMDFHVKVQEMPVKILGKTDAKTEKQFLVSDDIILVCELSRSNASVNWYKDDQLIDDTERHCSEEQGVFRSLVVLNAELEDSGEYTCDAVDDKMVFYITVKEPPVQIIGNSGHPEHHILLAGDDLILECEVSRPDATPSDSGKYVCDAIDDKLITIVEVQEPPARFVNKEANNHISGYENESVTLCAIVSRERANVRWLKDGQLLNKDNIHISSEGNTHKLTINPLQLSDSGEYVCDVNTDEMYFSLLVKETSVKFSRPLENIVALRGSSLILRCEINKPKGDVQWLKDGQEISPSRRHTIRAQGRERSFTIHQIMEEDAGEYTCESTDDRTSATVTIEIPRVVEFIAELRNITVCEGEDAVFKCVVSPEDTRLVWRLNGKQVALNERTVISSNGLCHMLCIHNCMVSDSGRVTADAEGLVSETELQVQEQQVLFTNKMTPVVAEEYSEATLEVEVSVDSGEVQWMRQGVLIHPGAKYTLKHNGRKHSLTIHKLAMSDRGTYSCETLHDRTQAQLTVEPRKITIKKGLADLKTTERETASFEVELSHPDVTGTWLRNGVQLKPTNHFRMSAKGHVHSLTISNLSVEDTGTFTFSVEHLQDICKACCEGAPSDHLQKTGRPEVP